MTGSIVNRAYFSVIIWFLIIDSVTRSMNLKDREKGRFSISNWVTSKALDVWYGNGSMVDVLSGEMSDVIEKIASRPRRLRDTAWPHYLKLLVPRNASDTVTSDSTFQPLPPPIQDGAQLISRVDINFINDANETIHTIQLRPQPDRKFEYLKAKSKKKGCCNP